MGYVAAYLAVFLGGPALMLALTRRAATRRTLRMGAGGVAALTVAALLAQASFGLVALAMLWLAWVGAVALGVRIVMRQIRTKRGVALTKALGAMACVIPWIGLAAADWMAG